MRLSLSILFCFSILVSLLVSCGPGEHPGTESKTEEELYKELQILDPVYFGQLSFEKAKFIKQIGSKLQLSTSEQGSQCDSFSLKKSLAQSDIPLFIPQKVPVDKLKQLHAKDTAAMKKLFACYMVPTILLSNHNILTERAKFFVAFSDMRKPENKEYVENLASAYNENMDDYKQNLEKLKAALSKKLLPIPVSLALSQASQESGWGHDSKFARNCQNYYSVYHFGPSVVRPECIASQAKDRKLADYPNILASTEAYMMLLNSSKNYTKFRNSRVKQIQKGTLSGKALTSKLGPYAEDPDYSERLQKHIRINSYEKWDVIFNFDGDKTKVMP